MAGKGVVTLFDFSIYHFRLLGYNVVFSLTHLHHNSQTDILLAHTRMYGIMSTHVTTIFISIYRTYIFTRIKCHIERSCCVLYTNPEENLDWTANCSSKLTLSRTHTQAQRAHTQKFACKYYKISSFYLSEAHEQIPKFTLWLFPHGVCTFLAMFF